MQGTCPQQSVQDAQDGGDFYHSSPSQNKQCELHHATPSITCDFPASDLSQLQNEAST